MAMTFNDPNSIPTHHLLLQGDSIQAYVRKNHMGKFKPLIKQGEVYAVRDFKVGNASPQYRVVPNSKRIYFNITTSIRALTDTPPQIPDHAFYFPSKDMLQARVGNNTLLTDIIGCVVAIGPTTTAATGPMKEIDLENTSHSLMHVTLWGKATTLFDISPFEVDKAPVILTVTSTTIRKFKGMTDTYESIRVGCPSRRNLTTCTGMFAGEFSYASTTATRLFFNLKRADANALAARYAAGYKGVKIEEGAGSERLPVAEQATLNRLTIAQLLAMEWVSDNQTYFCTVVGEIAEVNERHGWCYISCDGCNKKVTPKDGSFSCPVCNKACSYPAIKYKIYVRVKDSTGSTTLAIFNDDVEKLLKIPASTLSDRLHVTEQTMPNEISSFVGKTFIFKIKVTDYNLKDGLENYTVVKIFEEVEPLQKRKIDDTTPSTHAGGSVAGGSATSSGQGCFGPVTPKKNSVDGKKMKLED